MKNPVVHRVVFAFLFAISLIWCNFRVLADTAWTSPAGGLWRDAVNWSFGVPGAHQAATHIANFNSKIVTVDAVTPATNLIIQRLNLSGPSGTNTLLLTDVTLELRSTFEMRAGSELRITNATMRMRGGDAGSSLNLNAGEIRIENGSIRTDNVSTRIGRTGRGVMLVEGGESVLNEVIVGRLSGSFGSVHLSGGLLTITGDLDLGDDLGSKGEFIVTGGELVATATNFTTRIGDDGNGSMIISNGTVRLDDVSVARHVTGLLHLAGGRLFVGDLSLGRFPNSTGMVFQAGGEFFSQDVVRVGREGRGELTVSGGTFQSEGILVAAATNTASGLLTLTGGTILSSSNLVVGTSVSTGEVVLAGGFLMVTNTNATATVEVLNGMVTLGGASIQADRLRVGAGFSFNHGTLSSANTIVSNGLPFVVGDGTNAATFHLRGGTHEFPNGLLISSNASLTGCGTIIGEVINQGTIATNCITEGPPLVMPRHSGDTFAFSFQSEAGRIYTVEYKDVLIPGPWGVLIETNGTGASIPVADPGPLPPSRFYRLRVE